MCAQAEQSSLACSDCVGGPIGLINIDSANKLPRVSSRDPEEDGCCMLGLALPDGDTLKLRIHVYDP